MDLLKRELRFLFRNLTMLSLQSWVIFAISFGVLYLIRRGLDYQNLLRSIKNHPGSRALLLRGTGVLNLLPTIPGIVTPGLGALFVNKHRNFAAAGWDIISNVTLFPLNVSLTIADATVIKFITSSRGKFPKPAYLYKMLSFFGQNIVASEGEQWKKYRKISAPAFSDRNNRLVWDETVNIMMDLFSTIWKDKDSVAVDHCLDITLPIALFVIGIAGFGRRIFWTDETAIVPEGHQMTFKDALSVVSESSFIKLMYPSWAMGFTSRLRRVRLAFTELERYMIEMIEQRKASHKREERYDLFSSLLDASDDGEGLSRESMLTDSELMGNIFIFLLAGHETSAHTLCFTFALLALYPEYQEALYRHIKTVIPDDRLPTYDEMPLFTYSMAVLYESLRMFPPVNLIPKYSSEDTVLVTQNMAGEERRVPVPQGSFLLLNIPALHYNERYWKDPDTFNPTRFFDPDWPRDAFAPFSVGARACIGRKFFETESICILTILMSRYRIHVKPDPAFAYETLRQRHERVLKARAGLTLTPVQVPLVFERR